MGEVHEQWPRKYRGSKGEESRGGGGGGGEGEVRERRAKGEVRE